MVRHKTRWMLVHLDFGLANKRRTLFFPTPKDLSRATQDMIKTSFGMAASDATMEVQVRFCDADTGLALMRVSRGNYPLVRASLTMMTSMPVSAVQDNTHGSYHSLPSTTQPKIARVVASVLSVHGSVRTAKRATMQYIQRHYRNDHVQQQQQQQPPTKSISKSQSPVDEEDADQKQKDLDRMCRAMEDRLRAIQDID